MKEPDTGVKRKIWFGFEEQPMLQVHNLHFGYGKTPILNGVSFEAAPGQLLGLFGPNGSGKTTLFKCCLKFLKYNSGMVIMDDMDIQKASVAQMARHAAYVPQEHKPPFPYLVREVVLMGRTPHLGGIFGISKRDKAIALEALHMLDIRNLADRAYNRLSGGQRQMVLIARAIAQETKLLFLDEPTSALDFSNQIRIWKMLRRITAQGITVIACSHDPNHVIWFCHKVVVLDGKGIVIQGTTDEVMTEKVLNGIYHEICTTKEVDGIRMVVPRGIT